MHPTPNVIGVIPCRMASTRLPGKPLRPIAGVPMIQRVYEGSRGCRGLREVLVATDAPEIASFCRGAGIPVAMTRADHVSGTDRVWEAAKARGAAAALNIQGDEPMVNGAMLEALLHALWARPATEVATLCTPIGDAEARLPSAVKVVAAPDGRALYFSRAPIPHPREAAPRYRKHLGFYAYSLEALQRFHAWAPSPLEQLEKLEQLRFLEHGVEIAVAETEFDSVGVDTPEDLDRAERYFSSRNAVAPEPR